MRPTQTPAVIDTLVLCRWLLPIVPKDRILQDYAVAIHDGRIVDLCPQSEATIRFKADTTLHLQEHLVMPGLINAHVHAGVRLLRGAAPHMTAESDLHSRLWPADLGILNADFVGDSTRLAMAEMIRSGTTCFANMYFLPEIAAEAARDCGMRCQLSFPVFDCVDAAGQNGELQIRKGLQLHDHYRGQPSIKVACAPSALSDETLTKIATYANELDLSIHINMHETQAEIAQSLHLYGERPLQRLFNLGLLMPATQLVHMTQLSEEDCALVEQCNAQVIYCPESNLYHANGVCPIDQLSERDVNVALGTDGAPNCGLDLFAELKSAALRRRTQQSHPDPLLPHQALRMVTIDGARALGWHAEIGSLEHGKYADMIAIEMHALEQQPLYNLASHIVQGHTGARVSHSWISGRLVMQDRQLLTLNEQGVIARAHAWQKHVGEPDRNQGTR